MMRSVAIIILISALILPQALCLGTFQSVAVEGILMCKGAPSVGTKLKLYEHDTFDPDDFMAETVTDAEGHFKMAGSESEMGKIEPRLNIYHHCNEEDSINPLKKIGKCFKKISITIPSDHISEGKEAKKTFDAGTINLAGSFPGETRDCLN